MKNVAIFGAGIAGLSAAHELAVHDTRLKITVYEKLDRPGGVARSKRGHSQLLSEYSWRGYAPWYHNVFNLLKRIPTKNHDGTVFDELSKPIGFFLTDEDRGSNGLNGIDWLDYLCIAIESIRNATASPDRIAEYAKINAADYLKPKMSIKGWKHFTATFGPWVGIDPERASLHHVMSFFVKNAVPGSPGPYTHRAKDGSEWSSGSLGGWSVFRQPTNEAWFDPWVKYLETLGVTFKFNESLELFESSARTVTDATLYNTVTGVNSVIRADCYILAISPFGSEKVVKLSGMTSLVKTFSCLVQDGPQNQISFSIGFNKKVDWTGTRRAVVVTNSEFNITLYRQDELWDMSTKLDSCDRIHEDCNLKGLWSGTACISYSSGKLYNKPIDTLTKAQFKNEIMYQLSKDIGFNTLLGEMNNGKTFSELYRDYGLYMGVWDGWIFNDSGITTEDPKFVDSTNTRECQPPTITDFENLLLAGAHVQTSTELWSMEAAAESGRRAASVITGDRDALIVQNKGLVLSTAADADRIFYRIGLPNIIDIFSYILLSIVIYFIAMKCLKI